MQPVFFYGLFMDAELLLRKGLNPVAPEPAQLSGYGLRIGARATLEKSASEIVYGALVRLSDKDLKLLYGEASVADYVPQKVVATSFNGREIRAICYLLPIDKLSGRNRGYAASLAITASKLGLPEEYVKIIRTWAQ
jgi:hypothetical protein